MTNPPTLLKALLTEKHWQTHRTFCTEYDKAAKNVDPGLVGSAPSRAQLHRWLSGELIKLPYADHCRVLEQMFPGWSAKQLFEPVTGGDVGGLLETIESRVEAPELSKPRWRHKSHSFGVRPLPPSTEIGDHSQRIGRKLLELQQLRRLSDHEVDELASLTGHIVALEDTRVINIGENRDAEITYDLNVLNLNDTPLTKISRELWFEHTSGGLDIAVLPESDRRIVIHRRHDTADMAKFAIGISPPIQPGEAARIVTRCTGGRFDGAHYWRHAVNRYTRHYTLRVRHCGIELAGCDAIEEYPDGAEVSAYDGILWDYDKGDVVMTLTRDYLAPGQAVTLRWDVGHGSS